MTLDDSRNFSYTYTVAERKLPDDPLSFIRECIRGGRILWTYHVNMRLGQRFIARETIIHAATSYEVVEEYPEDNTFRAIYSWGEGVRRRVTSCLVQIWKARMFGSSQRIILARKNGKRI